MYLDFKSTVMGNIFPNHVSELTDKFSTGKVVLLSFGRKMIL